MAEGGQAKVVQFAERSAQKMMPFGLAVPEPVRMAEALLFASAEPVTEKALADRLPDGTDISAVLGQLRAEYAMRGVNLVRVNDAWAFRTASDLSFLLSRDQVQQKKLSRAALEVLAIIAYHQPVTRAELEDIRGVETAKGTLDLLMETGWIRIRGRRKSPGRPVTYGTTEGFLSHFGLNEVGDLPGLQELKGAGLLEANLPPGFDIPMPRSGDELTAEEDPLDGSEAEQPLEMHLPEQSSGSDDESSGP